MNNKIYGPFDVTCTRNETLRIFPLSTRRMLRRWWVALLQLHKTDAEEVGGGGSPASNAGVSVRSRKLCHEEGKAVFKIALIQHSLQNVTLLNKGTRFLVTIPVLSLIENK